KRSPTGPGSWFLNRSTTMNSMGSTIAGARARPRPQALLDTRVGLALLVRGTHCPNGLRRSSMAAQLPTFADLLAARRRLGALACRTPLIEHPALNARVGGRVLLKAENLQRVGAFKFRGAYNKVDKAAFPGGVVACSSGNHAQGVAAAATLMGFKSAIVMPADAPRLKIERTRAFGAEVVPYDRVREDRDAIARALCASRHAAYVHPFDDPDVIAGQGTAGLEMMEQAQAMGAVPDIVLVGASGGGLISGVSIAVKEKSPATVIY